MCDPICDVISYCVLSCDIDKINVYEKILKSKTFLHKSPSKRWFRNGIRRAKAS